MRNILTRYEHNSGKSINYNKSVITFSPNTSGHDRQIVCNQLGVREVQTPGKYLGIPMQVGKRKVTTFGFLQDQVQ